METFMFDDTRLSINDQDIFVAMYQIEKKDTSFLSHIY